MTIRSRSRNCNWNGIFQNQMHISYHSFLHTSSRKKERKRKRWERIFTRAQRAQMHNLCHEPVHEAGYIHIHKCIHSHVHTKKNNNYKNSVGCRQTLLISFSVAHTRVCLFYRCMCICARCALSFFLIYSEPDP